MSRPMWPRSTHAEPGDSPADCLFTQSHVARGCASKRLAVLTESKALVTWDCRCEPGHGTCAPGIVIAGPGRHYVRVIPEALSGVHLDDGDDGTLVTFRVPDPGHRLSGVRLLQEVRISGSAQDFRRSGDDWELVIPRPP